MKHDQSYNMHVHRASQLPPCDAASALKMHSKTSVHRMMRCRSLQRMAKSYAITSTWSASHYHSYGEPHM
jgi:hypothetical protein